MAMFQDKLTRREYLYALWGSALVVLIGAVIGASYWYAQPRSRPISVANIEDVAVSIPVLRAVNRDVDVYLVRFDNEFRAWDAFSPTSGCRFIWVAFNRRFEDPCSGAKWCIDGTIADLRFKGATTLRGYETELPSDGQIRVYPLKSIAGVPLSPAAWVSNPMALQQAIVNCRLP
ncbi:MAG: hypothetical protein AAB393_17710 [Bacteroidota bacterium]